MKNIEKSNNSRIKQRRKREKEQRREDIIKAAEKLFLAKEFENTKMEEIAYEASLSKGTVYNYFNSKEHLYLVIACIAYKKLLEYTQRSIERVKPGLDKLRAFGTAYYRFSEEHPNYTKVIHDYDSKTKFSQIIMEKPTIVSTSREFFDLNQALNNYRVFFIQVINEGIEGNLIREDLDPTFLALTLSMLTGGLIKEITENKSFLENLNIPGNKIISLVFDWISEGLRPKLE
jgi:TetR/AcrR family transcriptional regulator